MLQLRASWRHLENGIDLLQDRYLEDFLEKNRGGVPSVGELEAARVRSGVRPFILPNTTTTFRSRVQRIAEPRDS